ncbi:MAG: hypothetical protein WB660_09420 [Candidatus Sulfotelmatobacter sp.]
MGRGTRYIRGAILAGLTVEFVLGVVIHGRADANLVNFGPAIVGMFVVALGLVVALACLVVGITLLFRRPWSGAGFYLASTAAFALLTG